MRSASFVLGAVLLLAMAARPAAARNEGAPPSGLSITKVESADPVTAGTSFSYTVTVANSGPDPADNVSWTDTLPTGTTFVSLSAPAVWTCSTPAVGAGGMVSCSIASLGVGSAAFTLTVLVDPSVAAGTILSNTANVTTTTTDDMADNSATETTTVGAFADLSVTKVDTPDPVHVVQAITYTITVTNAGPSNATSFTFSNPLPVGTTSFEGSTVPVGWTCSQPGGVLTCSVPSLAPGSTVITLVYQVESSVPHGTVITNTTTVASATPDPNPGNESATTTTTVSNPITVVSLTKTDTPDPVLPGGNITYTITATNNSSENLNAVLTELMPSGTTFVSMAVPAGWTCTPPPVGGRALFDCLAASWAPGSAVFTLVLKVVPPYGTTIANEARLRMGNVPAPSSLTAFTLTQVLSAFRATKAVSAGPYTPGSTITYTVVLSNSGPSAQADNFGNEFTDILPAGLTLVSATATSGTAAAAGANTVIWHGSIPAAGSVTITITATINPANAPGTTISNQGFFSHDADGNGDNESFRLTDNPDTDTIGADPTSFVVAAGGPAPGPANIPALDEAGLALLVLLLAMGGALTLRKRRT
jgi:uncharacterized repeat protein (TIGR01451 family)